MGEHEAAKVKRYVWDIETDGLGRPGRPPRELVCVVRWGPDERDSRAFWGRGCAYRGIRWAIDDAHTTGHTARLWAHYGGGFDARFVIPRLCGPVEDGGVTSGDVLDIGSTVLRFRGRFASTRVGGPERRFELCDSIRLLPGSLARIGDELAFPKLAQSFTHRRSSRCRCTACLYRRDRRALFAYCDRDTQVLWRALEWADRLLASIGVDRPRLTLAGNAAASVFAGLAPEDRAYTPHGERDEPIEDGYEASHRLWDALLVGEEPASSSVDVDRDVEAGAYGGRTEVFRRDLARGYLYDRRASYPAAMTEGPLPWRYAGAGRLPPRPGLSGFVWADVEVAEHVPYPVLPWRDPEGKLLFPVGRWRGCFYNEELAYAVDNGLARVRRLVRGEWWEGSTVLGAWALDLWDRIQNATGFTRYFWKILRNAAYGKFLQRREQRSYIIRPESCEGLSRVHDALPLFYRDAVYHPATRNVATGAAITARARVALHRAITAASLAGEVAYCDTDSVVCGRPLGAPFVGAGLGDWDLQERVRRATFLAPKLYRYTTGDGETVVKAKGVRAMTSDEFDDYARGEAIPIERGRGWRETIGMGELGYERVRTEKRWLMGARPKRAPDGKGTRPWVVRGEDYAESWEEVRT